MRSRSAGRSAVTYHVDPDMHGLTVLAGPVMKLEFEKLAHDTRKKMIEVPNRLG